MEYELDMITPENLRWAVMRYGDWLSNCLREYETLCVPEDKRLILEGKKQTMKRCKEYLDRYLVVAAGRG